MVPVVEPLALHQQPRVLLEDAVGGKGHPVVFEGVGGVSDGLLHGITSLSGRRPGAATMTTGQRTGSRRKGNKIERCQTLSGRSGGLRVGNDGVRTVRYPGTEVQKKKKKKK